MLTDINYIPETLIETSSDLTQEESLYYWMDSISGFLKNIMI